MKSYLTSDALLHLKENFKLQNEICNYTGLKISGINTAIIRNSSALTTYKSVVAIAKSMDVKPENILVEYP